MSKSLLIIFAGLIGTGKSTLADILAKRLDIPILSSDTIRKELSGIPPEEHKYEDFEKGIYGKEFTDRTYEEMFKRAREFLTSGSSLIIDASFKKRYHRKLAFDMASELGVRFYIIETVCNSEEIEKRLNARIKNKESIPFKYITGQASDGRWEIYKRQKDDFDAMNEIDKKSHITVDTTESIDTCIEKIIESLRVYEI
ncbi:MAG: AAA family ATPase [Nitrospinota bacterium]